MKKYLVGTLSLFLMPAVAFAQYTGGTLDSATRNFVPIINNLTRAVNALVPFFLAIAVVFFIYGVIKYVLSVGADDKALARGYIIYGIIGIAVIVSLFGLVKLLQNTFGISGNEKVPYPQVDPLNQSGY